LHDSAQIQTPYASSAINILNSNITVIGNDNIRIHNHGMISLQYNNINITGHNSKASILKYNSGPSNINVQYNNITITGNNDIAIYGEQYWSNSRGVTYNSINMNGSNNTAIYYKDTSSVWLENSNITINTDTQQPAIILDNTNSTITNNQIIANTQETPLIISNGTTVSVTNNYLESIDLKGDNTVMGATTVNSNTPTDTGFKSNIDITTETISQYAQNTINVTVTDSFGETITGTLTATANGKEITITDNIIKYTPTNTDEIEISVTYTDPTGKYNTTTSTKTLHVTPATITVDPITATVGQTINITARITADNETITDINKGKVTFKVNGKTLKDVNGKVIYAKVVNGTATIENYLVLDDWSKGGTTIQAVYSGSTQCDKLTSEKTDITIIAEEPTLTTSDIQATAGETITLTATITDNDKIISTGKIVFKINGKTVKDENGKVIYAKVVNNQVSVEYTLPADMKAKNYNITATFISSDYERIEDTKTLTITA
ncbi:MAG: Ig-like domain repeat protein, partial [Methanosphaera sp.]|nr:Ig-like domain repeat protein [Methanosphaera sp.]